VVVAPLQIEGELSQEQVDRLETDLLSGLERAGLDAVPPDEVVPGDAQLPCRGEAACVTALAKANDATHVLEVELVRSGRDYDLTMSLSSGRDGAEQAKTNQQCEICGLKELGELIGDQAASLQPKLEAVPATLSVRSDPGGASVYVDGKLIGVTPIEEPLPEGKHEVRIALEGYVERRRSVTAVSGSDEAISLQLQPVPVAEVEGPDGRGMRIAGWTLLGVGLGALAGGATMLVLDERPVESRCTPENIDINGTCRYRYNTLEGGAGLAAAGGAMMVTAAVLVAIGYKRKKQRGGSRRAAVTPTGFGVRIRF
jgi:hypothetical protein